MGIFSLISDQSGECAFEMWIICVKAFFDKFSVFLIFMGGGVVSTAVEAWYRATPGTQKIRLWEVLVHLLLIASCVGISALLWR